MTLTQALPTIAVTAALVLGFVAWHLNKFSKQLKA